MLKNYFLVVLLCIACSITSYGQTPKFKVITTEISRGTVPGKEYIELFVDGIKTCSEDTTIKSDSIADLSGMLIYDPNGAKYYTNKADTIPGIASGKYYFPISSFPHEYVWDSIPYGTVILIYNDRNKNNSITFADDSLAVIRPNTRVIPISWLKNIDSTPPIRPITDTILYSPAVLNLQNFHNIFLILPLTPPYINIPSLWRDSVLDRGTQSPGFCTTDPICNWWKSVRTEATKALSANFKINPEDTSIKYCPNTKLSFCGLVGSAFPSDKITFHWYVNDTLIINDTTLCFDTLLNQNDVVRLNIKTSLVCIKGADSINLVFTAVNIYPDGGIIKTLITHNDSINKPIIDSLGTDTLGVSDTTRYYINYCKGGFVKLAPKPHAFGAPASGPSDNFVWFSKLKGTAVSFDSCYVDSSLKSSDTLLCIHTTSIPCVKNPIDTTFIFLTALDSLAPPKIVISTSDTNVCSTDTICFTATLTPTTLSDTTVKYGIRWMHNLDSLAPLMKIDTIYTGNPLVYCFPNIDYPNYLRDLDSVRAVLYTHKTNTCPIDTTTISNTIIMHVTQVITPSVTIKASQEFLCPNPPFKDTIVFTADTSKLVAGIKPIIWWTKNDDTLLGIVDTFYIAKDTAVKSGDIFCVHVKDTSDKCARPDTAKACKQMDLGPVVPNVIINQNPLNICDGFGTSVSFTARPTNEGFRPKYTWLFHAASVGQPIIDVTPTINPLTYINNTPVNLDTVFFILESSVQCAQPKIVIDTIVIKVQSSVTPSVKISADSDTLCFNTSTTVRPNPTNGGPTPIYEWYLNGISQSLGATYTYTGSTTGDYVYCKLTSSAPCALIKDVFSDTVYFTVNPLPIVPPILPDPTSVCVGASKQLTNTASGGTWASSNSSILVIDPAGKITGVSAGNTNVSYSLTDANNCTASSTLSIEVLPTTVPALTGKSNICVGEATLITNGIPASNWISDNITVADIQPTGVVTGISNGTAILTYTLTNFCGTTVLTFPINVGLPPVPTISGQNVLCNINDNTTLQSTTLGGTWTSSDPTVAQIDLNNGVVTAKGFGTTTITYSVTNDCGTTPATIQFTVGSPQVNEIQGDNTICTGFFTQLTNTTTGGTWSSSNPSIATVGTTTNPGKVDGVSAGNVTISYTVTNSCGTTKKDFAITVLTGPAVNAIVVPDPIICINQTTTLSHPTPGGQWASSNGAVAMVDPISGTVTGKTNGDVEISYTLNNGCGKIVVKANIHVGSPIIGAYTFKNPICVGEVTTLTNNTKGATSYFWISLNSGIASILTPSTGEIKGIAAGNASIFYIATNKCGATNDNSSVLNVIGLPVIASIQGKDSLCVNETSTYTNDTTKGVWSLSDTNIAKIDSVSGLVKVIQSGIDTVKYTVVNSNGCSNTVVKAIVFNALPVVQPIAGKLSACFNRTTLLTNLTPNGLWSSSNPAIADFQDKSIGSLFGFANGVTKVTYTVVNQFGCINTVDTTISVNPIPNVDSIKGVDSVCVNSSVVLTNATKGGVWATAPLTTATISSDLVTGNGILKGVANGIATVYYTVTVLGCDSTASFKIKVDTNNVAEIVGANIICVGGSTQLTNATVGGVGTWGNTTNNAVVVGGNVTGVKNGQDTIKYSYKNNCGITVKTFPITIGKPPVQPIIGRDSICVGTSAVLTNPTSGGIWTNDFPSLLTTDLGSGKITAMKAGLDSVRYTVTGIGGCFTVVAKAIHVIDLPIVKVNSKIIDTCKGISFQLAASPFGGVWTSANPSIANVNTLGYVTGLTSGTTQVNYVYTDPITACVNADFAIVNIIAPPVIGNITYGNNDSSKLHIGLSLQLSDTTIGGIWLTSQPTIASVDNNGKVTGIAEGQADIFYKVTKPQFGCVDSAKITIVVLNQLNDLYIPNYLYPLSTNVDNKKFRIYGKYISSLKLKIFSQWGQLMYETNDKDGSGWDGTFKGKEQPVGVYVYVADIVLKSGETVTKKGAVNLIR